jgi:outer membrane protein assembly factor BamB
METNAPLKWSRTTQVRWRAALPGPGNSTPIVWGNTVYVTQSVDDMRSLIAIDRVTGKVRWSAAVKAEGQERAHWSNPLCASSPATDGERIYAWFGTWGLMAFDFNGKGLWRALMGRQDHHFGYWSSPVVDDERVYLSFGPGRREFVVCLDKRTGDELWRVQSPEPGGNDVYGTWSTPLLTKHEGQPQLLIALRDYFAGVDPATGSVIWSSRGLGKQAKASPFAGEGVAIISGDYRSAELAVRLGGRGDVTETHRLWRESPSRGRIATSIIHEGHIYGARVDGVLDCLDLQTGDVVWAERQPGAGANSAIWSSPVLVGDLLYVINQGGDTVIYKASPKFEVVAVNSIGETCNASLVVAYGDLFIRTWQALWCIRPEG